MKKLLLFSLLTASSLTYAEFDPTHALMALGCLHSLRDTKIKPVRIVICGLGVKKLNDFKTNAYKAFKKPTKDLFAAMLVDGTVAYAALRQAYRGNLFEEQEEKKEEAVTVKK